ncbi:MAG TPA: NAD(P)H-hydrate epimerase, partial [Micropruina sp.]|nr:NAD(P)H-hydrate epimerase [Micropruina sp.]
MRPAYLAATIRAAEEPLLESMPGVLMQRAAAGLASAVLREVRQVRGRVHGARVLLAVGAGNNGGDALYAGVRLLRRGVRVDAWRTAARVHEEAWTAFRAAGGGELDAVAAVAGLAGADLVVDGVLGIGGRPGLREPVALFARACAD